MIKFSLICDQAHEFDSWFANSGAFETQSARALIACPVCNSVQISKAVMAPFVAAKTRLEKTSSGKPESGAEIDLNEGHSLKLRSAVQALRAHVVQNATDVGTGFPEEARKQHFGEVETKPIYGQASAAEVAELLEEGVSILPLPAAAN